MNRLQKKCVIVSTGLHALLVGILLFGSAFFNSQPKDEQHPLLTAFDPSMINDLLTKGGNPNVAVVPPPSHPPSPPSEHKQQEVARVVDPPKPRRIVHEEPDPPVRRFSEDAPPPKPKKRETLTADDLKLAKPRSTKTRKVKQQSESPTSESDNTAQRESQQVARSLRTLSKDLSSRTTVQEFTGPGGGGPLSAAYRDILANTYDSAWSSPPDLSDENAKVAISVTIARDGRVINGRIINTSHNSAMDRSIQILLDTVTYVAPFPAGWSESERSFEIVLSLRAKH